jgi:hypothetical protein
MTTQGRHRITRRRVSRPLVALGAGVTVALIVSGIGAVVAANRDAPEANTTWNPVVADNFDREAGAGWGSAELGGLYALSAPQYFSTDGGHGVAAPPRSGSSLTASLDVVAARDVLATTTVAVPTLPEKGNGLYVGVQARATANAYYIATARVGTGGSVYLSVLRVVGSTATQVALVRDIKVATAVSAGQALHLEFSATGDSPVELRARAWTDDDEPGWQASVADSSDARLSTAGAVGLWSYVSSSSAPAPFVFDDFEAFELITTVPTGEPTSTPTPDPTVDPTPETDGARGSPGADAVGSARYPVPDRALYVAPGGDDSAAGTMDAPFATIPAAIRAAPSGTTIVLREGSYHGSVVIGAHKTLTLQNYPGEAAWLDGSRVVDDWSESGDAWVHEGWEVEFDASPTYSRGAPDGTKPGWQFVNPDYPMAAHPDQVWFGDSALTQVGAKSQLKAGTFFVDDERDKLWVGSDPNGETVRAADTVKALTVSGPGSVVRGIGIHRYSPSVPDIGAVAVSGAGSTLEQVTITDSATTGLAIFTSEVSLVDVTILRSGMLGAQASTADGLRATGLLVADNNTEHFNRAPVSGGFKIHKSREVEVSSSAFLRNRGNGLWFDESVYDMSIVGNDVIDSVGNGIVVELSAKALIVDNIVMGSAKDGVLVSDSGHVDIWNNTIAANDRGINIVQGTRRAADLTQPGHDARQKLPDPTVTWITEDISIGNNVLADGRGKCVLCVEDYSHERSAAQMDITSNGNVLQRIDKTHPSWVVVWSRGVGNPAVYTSVAAFTAATGQDADSLALDAQPALAGTTLAPAVVSVESAIARPMPADIAAGARRSSGVRHLGAWD